MTKALSQPDTRQQDGFAVISLRKTLLWRVRNTGCTARHLALQDDMRHPLPPLRPPLLLDTVELPVADLVNVLLDIRTRELATLAIVNPHDLCMRRLLPLCPSIRIVMSDRADLGMLPDLAEHLTQMRCAYPAVWLGVTAPVPLATPLPERMLDLLHALPQMPTYWQAGEAGWSRAAVFRTLSDIRSALCLFAELPEDHPKIRPAPADMATFILHMLADPIEDPSLPEALQRLLRRAHRDDARIATS